ncbi:hypothetical protein PQX77_019041 [Marasmius sp. AFHP31]|nr:hypothetical protein PQX77_019041 [Marasmius sp. AFHP31]
MVTAITIIQPIIPQHHPSTPPFALAMTLQMGISANMTTKVLIPFKNIRCSPNHGGRETETTDGDWHSEEKGKKGIEDDVDEGKGHVVGYRDDDGPDEEVA